MQNSENDLGFGPWALLSLAILASVFFGFFYAAQFRTWIGGLGVGGLIFLSAAIVGALLGFIFAVPRVVAADAGQAAVDASKGKVLSTNTNLERISDWLTTMLVGVGLSQLTNLDQLLFRFHAFLVQTVVLVDDKGHTLVSPLPAVGPFILVLGAASGFLFMYLLTRLELVGFFRASEDVLSGVAVAAIRVAVTQSEAEQAGAPLVDQAEPETGPDESDPIGLQSAPADPEPLPTQIKSAPAGKTFLRASRATTLSKDDALEVMFELLYKPGGFRRVIQMSGELSRSPIAKRADYWFYLAAAFGQQMHQTEEGSDERRAAEGSAMDAARRAVSLDKSFRARLWQISDPNSSDNDLSLLRDQNEFRRLVGQN